MKIQGKVWVVTGGGSGMGRELVLQLLAKGAKVATCDIHLEAMEETLSMAGNLSSNLSVHVLDITDQEKVSNFPKELIQIHGAVDGIINNAGIIQPFVDVNNLEFGKVEQVMKINFYGTLYMVKAFLPELLKRPEAHIANVSSMGGFIPFPGQTIYGASKAAVKLLTEGLYAELKDTNVKVTVIHPGAVNTHITENSGVSTKTAADSAQAEKMALPASQAAEIMISGIEKDKFRILVGKDASFLDKFYRLSPEKAVRFIVKKMGAMMK